ALFLSQKARSLVRRATGGPESRIQNPESKIGRWLEHLRRADQSTQRLLRHRVLLSTALAITVIIHFLAVSAVMLAARALRMEWNVAAIGDYYVYIATGNVVAAVPISFQGAGTMEAVYFLFLKQHGTFAQLLCLAIALRMIHLLWSLPGALVMLTGAYRPRHNGEPMQTGSEPGLGPA
ncbi:MAG TPA: lysylphosphatidylglycerol synthase domain-containing protein, partial [Phycisphaerae bacterium]